MMRSTLVIFLFSCFLIAPAQATVGFSAGAVFKATPISGQVQITCSGPGAPVPAVRIYQCFDKILSPTSFDTFIGPQGIDADQVSLAATHLDGSVRIKVGAYDALHAMSAGRFNLWVLTLTQNPLLDMGLNRIQFILTKSGHSVQQGNFNVQVNANPTQTCAQTGYYQSNQAEDCENQYLACSWLFRDQHNCMPAKGREFTDDLDSIGPVTSER